jgi:hypothetical protein
MNVEKKLLSGKVDFIPYWGEHNEYVLIALPPLKKVLKITAILYYMI